MHIPVLPQELMSVLNIRAGGTYMDCTGGGGGHAALVASQLTDGRLFILDRDPEAVERLNEYFKNEDRVRIIHANFRDVRDVMIREATGPLDGIYADFGMSSWQVNTASRGFSFKRDGELDMRMDPAIRESARDVVNKYSEALLSEIIYRYGGEKFGGRISRAIVTRRNIKPFVSTLDLATVVKNAMPAKFHKPGYHPATQTFQALRIHVNGELEAIESLLRALPDVVAENGSAAFISFHSLEDKLVKDYFTRYEHPCTCPPEFPVCACGKKQLFKVLTKKPIVPTEKEVKTNPLSRSAKLRAAQRVTG
jgi:16S rRNA (cytosine1402-N4)-methyltransferase